MLIFDEWWEEQEAKHRASGTVLPDAILEEVRNIANLAWDTGQRNASLPDFMQQGMNKPDGTYQV